MLPKGLHTSRPRSKSLGDISDRQSPRDYAEGFEQAHEYTTTSANRSRSACGPSYPTSPLEALSTTENVAHPDNFFDQKASSPRYGEVFGEDIENTFKDASPQMTNENDGNEREDGNIWPPKTTEGSFQDQDTALWSNNLWSASSTRPSANAAPSIPLPAPNDLTSTYLPFSSHLALTNHFTPSTLTTFQTLTTPIFLHSVLQLPSTLAQLLSLRTSDLLCRLTPSILLNHTTILDATTLLPSLVPTTTFSTYHHVNGLLYFPQSPEVLNKINDFLTATHTTKTEMRKVDTQTQDSEGKRHEIGAWAWVAVTKEGTEEWWTLEGFVAGRIVGYGTVEW